MGRTKQIVEGLVPLHARALLLSARSKKGQGSLEYIMMIAAASIVIVLALVMVVKLRGSIPSNVVVDGTNTSITSAISTEIGKLSGNVA